MNKYETIASRWRRQAELLRDTAGQMTGNAPREARARADTLDACAAELDEAAQS